MKRNRRAREDLKRAFEIGWDAGLMVERSRNPQVKARKAAWQKFLTEGARAEATVDTTMPTAREPSELSAETRDKSVEECRKSRAGARLRSSIKK